MRWSLALVKTASGFGYYTLRPRAGSLLHSRTASMPQICPGAVKVLIFLKILQNLSLKASTPTTEFVGTGPDIEPTASRQQTVVCSTLPWASRQRLACLSAAVSNTEANHLFPKSSD